MGALGRQFEEVCACTPEAFRQLGQHVKECWLLEALVAWVQAQVAQGRTDTQVRSRKLPLEAVVWLVIAMALFRDRSIAEVVAHLGLSLGDGGVAPSAVSQARRRLGHEAVEHLFAVSAAHWAAPTSGEMWRGLTVYGLDGSYLRVADTPENEEAFGRPGGSAQGGYPQARLLALTNLRTHVLVAYRLGGLREGELTLVRSMWAQVPDNSVTVLDRGFVCWGALHLLMSGGRNRHFVVRGKAGLKLTQVRRLGRGDSLVEVRPAASSRREYPEVPRVLTLRRIQVAPKGYRPFFVLTSLLDAETYPAREVGGLYRERWEVELAYDEVKTHLLEREEALRSKSPEGVRQEVAGIALAYNLVRLEMARVAEALGVSPLRLSFRHALQLIRAFALGIWAAAQGVIGRRLGSLRSDVRLLLLPERRTRRRYPRQVKRMTTSYTRKPSKPAAA